MRPHRRRDHVVRARSISARAWRRPGPRRLSPRRLDELIERAIVDAYGPSEQAVGFHATLEQELALPFETVVLGVTVSVKKLDITDREEVVAVCCRGRERQAIPLEALPLSEPPPAGWEWIEAYRRWARGQYAAGKAR